MLFHLTRLYAKLYVLLLTRFNINLRGLGFLLRRLKGERLLHVQGVRMFFDSRIATSYARLITGSWNEPETHLFARNLANLFPSITFLDVGANIGEMAIDFARIPSFHNIIAFEPDPICANIISINAALNNAHQVKVANIAISNTTGTAYLHGAGTPQAFLSTKQTSKSNIKVPIQTLDFYLKETPLPKQPSTKSNKPLTFMLVDVEGHEVEVFQGAKQSIAKHTPLIVFEFNAVSRKQFSLTDVRKALGPAYTIYRLNQGGRLDTDLINTWNCVAVHESQLKTLNPLMD